MLDWPRDWDSYSVLASGSPTFAHILSTKLKSHHKGILLYAADIIFQGCKWQDVHGLLHRYSNILEAYGLIPHLVAHTDFGGATLAIHAVGVQGMELEVFCPSKALPCRVVHVISALADAFCQEIEAVASLEDPLP